MNAQGIDTSHYNGDITNVVQTTDFSVAQCTVGTWVDPAYAGDHETARNHHKLAAAYQYAVYGPGPTRQARLFLLKAGDADWLMVDAEERGSNRLLMHPKTISAIIINIRNLDTMHRKITLYASRATQVCVGFTPIGSPIMKSIWSVVTEQDANHVADYVGDPMRSAANPRVQWKFWQKSGIGTDRDEFNGTLAELHAFAGR